MTTETDFTSNKKNLFKELLQRGIDELESQKFADSIVTLHTLLKTITEYNVHLDKIPDIYLKVCWCYTMLGKPNLAIHYVEKYGECSKEDVAPQIYDSYKESIREIAKMKTSLLALQYDGLEYTTLTIETKQASKTARHKDSRLFFNLSVFYALQQKHGRSKFYLKLAIAKGYSNWSQMLSDQILNATTDGPDFENVLISQIKSYGEIERQAKY